MRNNLVIPSVKNPYQTTSRVPVSHIKITNKESPCIIHTFRKRSHRVSDIKAHYVKAQMDFIEQLRRPFTKSQGSILHILLQRKPYR